MKIITTCLTRSFRLFAGDRKGVTALEYGLIAGGVAMGILASVYYLGSGVGNTFNLLANSFPH